jgi:peptidoglycan hydrolase-like protein with peptidoglycan-binding domain
MSVQTKLANQGYYHGQVDGIIGSGSVEAIRRFPRRQLQSVGLNINPIRLVPENNRNKPNSISPSKRGDDGDEQTTIKSKIQSPFSA